MKPLLLLLSCLPMLTYGENYIVVGGGISGINAARTIINQGQGEHNVFVLEARNGRYGGRINTDTVLGFPVDMGATWITGDSVLNPIGEIVADQEIETVVTIYRDVTAYDEVTGERYSDEEETEGYRLWLEMLSIWGDTKDQYTYDDSVRDVISGEGMDETHYNNPVLLMFHNIMFEGGYAHNSNQLSGMLTGTDSSFPGDHGMFPDGYIQVVDYLVQGDTPEDPDTVVDVRLDQEVVSITVGDTSVTVTTWGGTEYTADKVIVAVPLGVLKSGAIVFEPPLDQAMQDAIDSCGFGLLNKLVIEFDEVFWDSNVTYEALAPADEFDNGLVKDFWSLVKVTGRPVLMSWGSGDGAWVFEGLSDQELLDEALANLALIFGDAVTNVVGMARTRWSSDLYARGSYYHPAVGQQPGQQEELGLPRYDCKVLFAGEHISDHWGTVQGAYLTGEQAALDAMSGCAH